MSWVIISCLFIRLMCIFENTAIENSNLLICQKSAFFELHAYFVLQIVSFRNLLVKIWTSEK